MPLAGVLSAFPSHHMCNIYATVPGNGDIFHSLLLLYYSLLLGYLKVKLWRFKVLGLLFMGEFAPVWQVLHKYDGSFET